MSTFAKPIPEGKIVSLGKRLYQYTDASGIREITNHPVWQGFKGKDMTDAVSFLEAKGLPPARIQKVLKETIFDRSISAAEMLWLRYAFENDMETPDGRAAFEAELFNKISEIRHPTVRRHYQQWFRQQIDQHFGANYPRAKQSPRSNVTPFRSSKTALLNSLKNFEASSAEIIALRDEGCFDTPPRQGGE